MENCYEILGVRHDATISEIKRAFRKKAKLLHPDMSKGIRENREFHRLVHAYEILTNTRERSLFDEQFFMRDASRKRDTFDYHTWLCERTDDESRAKLIFWDLLHLREDEAVAEFKQIRTNRAKFSLRHWFTREDFMDYGFILAEELFVRGEYYEAAIILFDIIEMEKICNYFRLFFPEVISFATSILKNNLDGTINDELALDLWERALDLGFPSQDNVCFLRKMAETYSRIGDERTAQICLAEAEHESQKK